ncbi:LOW QUALITY PROTEIN: polycystic kidney disease protein 1-like 2 [Pomacea canaliculata]|uniref:LOW QUALITY PROTEIN: polycystic kidney disease protein 1-like 2 n=1 Tax=Pomacea canaliculata TaxID=400727 RepID=UPI000D739B51|nr:LOW QUALITY PROTEIN: polycystic kidney disease protein 1-like 2 [Pomacea canaliculata]
MSSAPTATETVCTCDNPPGVAFASAFMVPPNTIDFKLVFSKFDPNNASVYGTLIGLLLVWVLGVVWARRQDKKDKEKWLVSFLKDNAVEEGYLYLLTVHTGLKRGSGTKSNVSFVLGGSHADSGIRVLSDGKRALATGSVMRYIMATGSCLGHLDYVRIWHDNSGGSCAGWFLRRMDVEDLQTGQSMLDEYLYERTPLDPHSISIVSVIQVFVCMRAMAGRGQGQRCCRPSRSIGSAGRDHVLRQAVLGVHQIGITDTHLWLSCFMRPAPSTFTRVQRVSCCLVLLLLTMITSAMFYKAEDSETGASASEKLFYSVCPHIDFLNFPSLKKLFFSHLHRLRGHGSETCFPALLRDNLVDVVSLHHHHLHSYLDFCSYLPQLPAPIRAQGSNQKCLKGEVTKAADMRDTPDLKENTGKSEESPKDSMGINLQTNLLPHYWCYIGWLLLMATAATCAFFLVLYSMQWGITTSEEWLASFVFLFFESIFVMDPIKIAWLLPQTRCQPMFWQKSRKRRLLEQESQRVFYDLLLHSFFVFCVFSLSYGSRDLQSFSQNNHLDYLLYNSLGWCPISLRKWERTRMVKGYSSLLGRRQYCPPYSMGQEETEMYCVGWKPLASCSYEERNTKLSRVAWMYQSFEELEENIWLDEQTRAVFVEFSLYNPDSNLFSYLRLSAEFPETGASFIGRELKTFHIYQHLQANGLLHVYCRDHHCSRCPRLHHQDGNQDQQQKLLYFSNSWQMLDLFIVLISYGAVAFYAIKTVRSNDSMAAWRDNPKQYVDFYQTAFWDNMYGYWLGAVVFLTTIRLLRILGYNRRLTMIAAVLANSGRDLFGFSLVFAVVFTAYLTAGYIVFASTLSEFRTPLDSAYALCQMLLGRNVLAAFSEDLEMFAWIFFISYVILVFMILMTMFQAILCGTSTTVRTDISTIPAPYGLTNMFVKVSHIIADLLPAWLVQGDRYSSVRSKDMRSQEGTQQQVDMQRQALYISKEQ